MPLLDHTWCNEGGDARWRRSRCGHAGTRGLLGGDVGNDAGEDLGYAPGGAQDVDNFRDNVEAGHLPLRSDITHEGLFYDYYFETGERDCDELFCPAYSRAVTAGPLSNETERYLSVGLNSNLEKSEFEREKLNLVVVLDVSGSMDSGMAEYHYDGDESDAGPAETKPKMDAANEATVALVDQLEDDDRFALITFDDRAETVASPERMDERDRDALEAEIRSIEADGGTNLESGMDRAHEFEYMVTPMVYDLELAVESEGYEIEDVYGSPDADEATGELMSVNTLFPSPTEDGASKGGVVLLELNGIGDDPDLELTTSYENRDGERYETTERVTFDDREAEYFETDGVRKSVVLSRYATSMENWIDHERASLAGDDPEAPDGGLERTGAVDLGQWERQSTDLQVSPAYAERIDAFRDHFAAETDAVEDDSLERELETMATILEAAEERSSEKPIGDGTNGGNESAAVAPPVD